MLFLVALLVALPGSYGATTRDELQSTLVLNENVLEKLPVEKAMFNDNSLREILGEQSRQPDPAQSHTIQTQSTKIHLEDIIRGHTILAHKILALEAEIGALDAKLQQEVRNLSKLKKITHSKDEKVQKLEEQLRVHEEKIQTQEEKIQTQEEKFQAQEEKIQTQEEKIQAQEEKIQAQEEKIQTQEEKIQAQGEKIQTQEEKIEGHEQEVQQLSEQVRELKRQEETGNVTTVETPRERNETEHLPRDCSDHWTRHERESGLYTIFPVIGGPGVDVWCDMAADGPWTVILSRSPQPHPENFSRSWEEYKAGFGNASTEYWLGLDALHALTSRTPHLLKVQIQFFEGQDYDGGLDEFVVSDEDSQYEVRMEGGYGIGKYLRANNGKKFSTTDRDNEKSKFDCVKYHGGGGGWWYGFGRVIGGGTSFVSMCTLANPTAKVARSEYADDGVMRWLYEEKGRYITLKKVVMRIQPNFK